MQTDFVLRLTYIRYDTPERLKQAIALAQEMGCTRVMLFNTRGHHEPAHLDREENLRRAEVMRGAVAAFQAAGLGVGINNLATIGMNFSPPRKHRFPFQNLVDHTGQMFSETFCPLDKAFQDYIEFLFATWASLGADEVWVDDDFRYKTNSAQCFCPRHLAAFSALTDREWSRESLVQALATDGLDPTDLARQWGAFQNQGLLEAARAIARGARRANPEVRIGLMGMTNCVHMYGSDYLRELCAIMNPDHLPLLRPEYLSYSDDSRTGWSAYSPLWCCTRACGDAYQPWPELETWPWTGFNHGRRVIAMKLAWGAAHGFTSSTINTDTSHETARTIRHARNHVRAIAEVISDPGLQPRGVSLELGENGAGLQTRPASRRGESLAPRILARLGLPLWPNGGCGRVLTSNAPLVRADELTGFAREGLLLDRTAFETVAALGRDDLLGGARSRPMGGLPVLERYNRQAGNGAAAGREMSMELAIMSRPVLRGFSVPDTPEFSILSSFEDADSTPISAGVWTREWEGGRLAVLPFSLHDPESENTFLNADRRSQLVALLEWLTDAALPVTLHGVYDLACVYRESADAVVVALANYALDDADAFEMRVPRLAGRERVAARILDMEGRWTEAELPVTSDGRVSMAAEARVPAQEVRLVSIAAN